MWASRVALTNDGRLVTITEDIFFLKSLNTAPDAQCKLEKVVPQHDAVGQSWGACISSFPLTCVVSWGYRDTLHLTAVHNDAVSRYSLYSPDVSLDAHLFCDRNLLQSCIRRAR
jgi:hypothetical protein